MSSSTLSRALGLAAATIAIAACAVPSHATSFTSSASSAGSASSGSVSDSIGSSSNSSSDDDKKVAAGEYRVIDVVQAPAKPGTTRITLRAADAPAAGPAREFTLDVPDRALAQRPVNAGELVQVSERVYGYEFAHADTRRSFFLALQDDWYRDLGSRKVTI